MNRQGLGLYVLLLGCLLLGPWNQSAPTDFGLVLSALRDGELWRFLTGPLVHSNWAHLGLSAAGLLLLQQLFGQEMRPVIACWAYVFVAVCIGICVLAFSRFGIVYGFSGALHGLFTFAACLAMSRDALLAAGTLLIVGGKVIWEQVAGSSTFMERLIDMPVATDVHLYGAASGAVLGAVMAASTRLAK